MLFLTSDFGLNNKTNYVSERQENMLGKTSLFVTVP
jgi:hypothetical protein